MRKQLQPHFVRWILPFFLLPIAVGLFVGWLVGASRSPVVASFLPLLFGFATTAGYRFIENQIKAENLAENLLSLSGIKNLPAVDQQEISDCLGVPLKRPNWLPMAWSIAIIVFTISSFVGVQTGIQFRIPSYTMAEMISVKVTATPSEMVLLQRAGMILQAQGIQKQKAQEIFQTGLVPILTSQDPCKKPENVSDSERYNSLLQAVNNLNVGLPSGSLAY